MEGVEFAAMCMQTPSDDYVVIDEALIQSVREELKNITLSIPFGKFLLKHTLEDVDNYVFNRRYPRVVICGQSGCGKSSLINAMLGTYDAEVGSTKPTTDHPRWHLCKNAFGHMLTLDTVGFFDEGNPEAQILKEIREQLQPSRRDPSGIAEERGPADLILYVVQQSEIRANDARGLKSLEKLAMLLKETNDLLDEVPVIAVATKCDQLTPSDVRLNDNGDRRAQLDDLERQLAECTQDLEMYEQLIETKGKSKALEGFLLSKVNTREAIVAAIVEKKQQIETEEDQRKAKLHDVDELVVHLRKQIFERFKFQSIRFHNAIGVCSEISWNRDRTRIEVDKRWHIEELMEEIIKVTPKVMHVELARISQIKSVQWRLAQGTTTAFAMTAAAIGAIPIPFADAALLIPLQALMTQTIAYISGRPFSKETAVELTVVLGGGAGVGWAARALARSLLRLAVPIAGSVISAGIAATGTFALGQSAIAYFIQARPAAAVREVYKNAKEVAAKSIREGKSKGDIMSAVEKMMAGEQACVVGDAGTTSIEHDSAASGSSELLAPEAVEEPSGTSTADSGPSDEQMQSMLTAVLKESVNINFEAA